MIDNQPIKFIYYISSNKLMRHYTSGEYSLDAIFVVEACVKEGQLNWSSYLCNELFEDDEDVNARLTYFIFGYFLIPLSMFNWCPHEGRDIEPVANDEPLTYSYAPRRNIKDLTNRDFNEHAFEKWCNKMVSIIENVSTVPLSLLDFYAHHIWFGISHNNSYVRSLTINPATFSMNFFPLYINENALHNEVLSWTKIIAMN